jgi:DNA-binding LytR/AlgR family response regulator
MAAHKKIKLLIENSLYYRYLIGTVFIKHIIMEDLSQSNGKHLPEGQPPLLGIVGQNPVPDLPAVTGKKSFLVFRHNKYFTVPTETIAFFYIKFKYAVFVCFDRQEYYVDYSLEQLEQLLPTLAFFRLNRQYLVSFSAVKEAERYFARKLLVTLIIPTAEKLLVSKEKASAFLRWLENR